MAEQHSQPHSRLVLVLHIMNTELVGPRMQYDSYYIRLEPPDPFSLYAIRGSIRFLALALARARPSPREYRGYPMSDRGSNVVLLDRRFRVKLNTLDILASFGRSHDRIFKHVLSYIVRC